MWRAFRGLGALPQARLGQGDKSAQQRCMRWQCCDEGEEREAFVDQLRVRARKALHSRFGQGRLRARPVQVWIVPRGVV